jgi:hypothetical protein
VPPKLQLALCACACACVCVCAALLAPSIQASAHSAQQSVSQRVLPLLQMHRAQPVHSWQPLMRLHAIVLRRLLLALGGQAAQLLFTALQMLWRPFATAHLCVKLKRTCVAAVVC